MRAAGRPYNPPVRPFTIPDAQGEIRLDRWLRKRFRDAPLSLLYKAIRLGWVRVNGERARRDRRLEPGDAVALTEEAKGFSDFIRSEGGDRPAGFRRIPLAVLYEDDDLIAVDKPPTIISQGISDAPEGSLLDQVRAHLRGRFTAGFRPELVHRLDRETSGVVLAAKTPRALSALNALFRERRIEKGYVALVKGAPSPPRGTLTGTVLTWREGGTGGRKRRAFRPEGGGAGPSPAEGAEEARAASRYETAERLGDFSLLRVRPETGRTHQIRLQLQAIGCPVAGDRKYGDPAANGTAAQFLDLNRLFLHAESLALLHPFTGARLDLRSPLPPDLARALRALRRHTRRAPRPFRSGDADL